MSPMYLVRTPKYWCGDNVMGYVGSDKVCGDDDMQLESHEKKV